MAEGAAIFEGRRIVLEAVDIVKRFGGVVALDGVTVRVPERGFFLLIGPNGSGKTTLVNVVTGFLKPDHGKVYFMGREITGLPPHRIARMGLVRTFQIPKPFMNLTVLENLLVAVQGNPGENPYIAPLHKSSWARLERRSVEKAFTILKWLGMESAWDKKATELSAAELKLLEVGRVLMSGARMVIMDEPAAGVNPTQAHEIFDTLRRLREEQGLTFLVIEHRIDIAAQYVDYVYAMHLGKVISQGPPDKVLRDPRVVESYLGG